MAAKEVCAYCNAKYVPPQSFCPKCQQPTRHASADERILWELSQWETTHGPSTAPRRAAAESPAVPAATVQTRPASKPAVQKPPVERPQAQRPAAEAPTIQRPAAQAPTIQRPAATAPTRPVLKSTGVVRSIGRAQPPSAPSVRTGTSVLAAEAAPAIDTQSDEIVVPEVIADSIPEIVTETQRVSVATVVHRVRVPERPAQATAPAPAPAKAPKPAKARKVRVPKAPKAPKAAAPKTTEPIHQTVQAPKAMKVAPPLHAKEPEGSPSRLRLQPNEKIEFQARGWSRLLPATLIVTTYRVALVRLGRVRWIPLEEVRSTGSGRSGLTLEASIELFRFRGKTASKAALEAIELALRESRRPNSRRHDAAVTQEWCDRCEIWDTHTGRIRLWLNRHPLLIVTLVAALVALVKVYTH